MTCALEMVLVTLLESYTIYHRALPARRYDLHVLLVGHGKRCPRCAANGRPRFEPDGPCPLYPVKGSVPKCAQSFAAHAAACKLSCA